MLTRIHHPPDSGRSERRERRPESEEHTYDVDIRWTSFGIPHIKAATYESLAFGVGYAYTRDNADLLADAVLTVRGIRSFHFGAATIVPHQSMSNLESDFFHKTYFDPLEREAAYRALEPLTASMLNAYASGVARCLRDNAPNLLADPYRQALRAQPITSVDLYLLLAEKAAQTSGCAFANAILAAQPPGATGSPGDTAIGRNDSAESTQILHLGSNAFALGRDLTETGAGLLVGNPHFPWFGSHRFFQMHLTIPGELDVMGASLPPFPAVNIGFNRDVAWTHTVSPSRRYAIYELALTRRSPLAYRVGWHAERMTARTISVSTQTQDGRSEERRRTFYATRYGPLIAIPEMGCTWTNRRAYALLDTAAKSVKMVPQWIAINKAKSVSDIDEALCAHRGALWLDTLAADRNGRVFFGDLSAVPNVSVWKRRMHAPSRGARRICNNENILVLNGSRRGAVRHPRGSEADIRASEKMPRTIRSDYVLNCNDSHWLVNASVPLRRFPRFVGREKVPQGFRTRMAHRQLSELVRDARGQVSSEIFKDMLLSNRNYAADLIMDDLIPLGARQARVELPDQRSIDLAPAFAALAAWSRCDDVDSRGAILFREFWLRIRSNPKIWRTSFDSRKPLGTPCDLNIGDPAVVEFLLTSLGAAAQAMEDCGWPLDIALGAVQRIIVDGEAIPIPGGLGSAGVLNLVDFGALTKDGYTQTDIQGTSYTQIVTWENGCVAADAILPYSQSSDGRSSHAWDQTRLFAQKKWIRLPFDEKDILSDPNLTTLRICQEVPSRMQSLGETEHEL